MGKSSKPSAAAASGSKKMKGLVEAAALMAGGSGTSKVLSSQDIELASYSAAAAKMPMPTLNSAPSTSDEKTQAKDANAARTRRLEQNRRAAIESRRRKKVMIAELQKSVAFYTKANESIKLDNLDLEQKLLLAKRSILQMKAGTFSSTLSLEQGSVAPSSIEFITKVDQPSIAPVLAPVRTDQILAQLSATQALCDSLETKSIASEVVAPIMPSGEDVGSEEYVESLKKVCCVVGCSRICFHRIIALLSAHSQSPGTNVFHNLLQLCTVCNASSSSRKRCRRSCKCSHPGVKLAQYYEGTTFSVCARTTRICYSGRRRIAACQETKVLVTRERS